MFTGLIYPDETLAARAIFAVGDLVDLAVSMFVLLVIFRCIRLCYQSR